jgi:hypothetical protein
MPYADIEARRAHSARYRKANPKRIPDRVEAADDDWYVLACTECGSLFDVPRQRTGGRLPLHCSECRIPARIPASGRAA